MKKLISVFLSAILVFSSTGCGTMIRGAAGTTTPVTVRTDPANASVYVDGMEQKTPAVFNLKKKQSYQIIIKKEGYKSVVINLRSKVKGGDVGASFVTNTLAFGWWTLGIGTAVGMLADASTGSMVDLDTSGIFVTLEPGEGEIVMEGSSFVPRKKKRKQSATASVIKDAGTDSAQGAKTSDKEVSAASTNNFAK